MGILDALDALFGALTPLWEMSLTAAYAAAIVAALRLVLKKRAPRQVVCLLWLVVFARLLVPISLESPVSIVPGAEQVERVQHLAGGGSTGAVHTLTPVQTASPVQNTASGQTAPISQGGTVPVLTAPEGAVPDAPQPPAPFPWRAALAGVWLAGAAAMGGYGLLSYLRLRRRLFDAIRAADGAWEHPSVASPFILGVIRPRIYLPAGLTGQPRQFILCHERAHLRRLDHVVKPVCWAALALHWFNPAVWTAFVLMSRDIEAACDEAVIRQLGPRVKADYSATLLSLATHGRVPAPCPLAFDEGDAKGRINNVLRYRRPALWIVVVSAIMAIMAAVCLLTDPVSAGEPPEDSVPPEASAAQPSQFPDEGLNALLDPWMLEVLNGERTFANGQEAFNIHQLRAMVYGDGELPKLNLEVGRLTILDLDKDGIREMVAWPVDTLGERDDPTEIGYYTGYFIFRRQGDTISVHYPGWRSMGDLKADGTSDWSSSAGYWGIGSAAFDENGMFVVKQITWCDNSSVDDDNYFVDGLKATKEEFEAAWEAHQAKPEPVWYTYQNGVLAPWFPDGLELAAQTTEQDAGEAKLWLEDGQKPWLEWNGSTTRIGQLVTPAQSPGVYCRDFDGDGENEAVICYDFNGFPKLDLYEWSGGQPVLAGAYDTQQMLLRFNRNNTAAVTPYGSSGEYALSVNYVHVEGEDVAANPDFYRHFVTGRCVLPAGFFDGYEHIRDGYPHLYASQYNQLWTEEDGRAFCFRFEFFLADETMENLDYVDTLSYADSAAHCMVDKPVGSASFTLRYDGTQWRLREGDQLTMKYGGDPAAAPSASPEPSAGQDGNEVEVKQVGNGYQISWGGRSFDVGPDITPDSCANIYTADFDGDGRTEAAFVLWESPIWMYDLLDNGSAISTSFDPRSLWQDLAANSTAAITPGGSMTFTYSWGALDESTRRFITTHADYPDSFFQGGNEPLKSGTPLTVSTANGGVRAYTQILYPCLDVSVTVALQVEDGSGGVTAGRVVGFQHYTVRYDGGFTVDVPGQLDIASDSAQSSTPSQPSQPPAAQCSHGLDLVGGVIQGNRYTLACKQDGYVYTVPSPVEAYNCELLPGDDLDGDGRVEIPFRLEDGRLVVCDFEDGKLAAHVFDPGTLFAGFDRNRTHQVVDDANGLTVSYQGQTVQVPLDRSYVITHHAPAPAIYRTETGYSHTVYTVQGDHLDLSAPVNLSACARDDAALYAHWSVRYTGGGLETIPGSFRFELTGT